MSERYSWVSSITADSFVSICLASSSPLEVKRLNREGKYECKEHRYSNNYNCNHSKKVISKAEIASYKMFHWFTRLKCILYIPILWSSQPIQGPRNRANPIEPSPPHRNPLLKQSTFVMLGYVWFAICFVRKFMLRFSGAYRSRNDESWENIPYSIEESRNYGSIMLVRSNCYSHHPIESVV